MKTKQRVYYICDTQKCPEIKSLKINFPVKFKSSRNDVCIRAHFAVTLVWGTLVLSLYCISILFAVRFSKKQNPEVFSDLLQVNQVKSF